MHNKYFFLFLAIIEFVAGFLISSIFIIFIAGKGLFDPNTIQRLIQIVIFVELYMHAAKNLTKFLQL